MVKIVWPLLGSTDAFKGQHYILILQNTVRYRVRRVLSGPVTGIATITYLP